MLELINMSVMLDKTAITPTAKGECTPFTVKQVMTQDEINIYRLSLDVVLSLIHHMFDSHDSNQEFGRM